MPPMLVPRTDGPVVLLIGNGGMAAQCATMLVKHGFDVAGVHGDQALREWVAERNTAATPFLEAFEHFVQWGETIEFDYLFSVVNFRVLRPSLFGRAKRLAINYHDGPLPRYAGSDATAWALRNGEREHGITWHVIEKRVDSGDILKQRCFPVAADETLSSLNQKCYLAGMRAFDELLRELKTGRVTRTPQDLSLRTFHYRDQTSSGPPGKQT